MKRYRKAARAYLEERGGQLIAEPRSEAGSYQWSDAWLMLALKAVAGQAEGFALENVLAYGEAINHAGFTPTELNGGFNRLERGGFITIDGSNCGVTEQFKAAWAESGADDKSTSKRWEAVKKILGVPE